MAGRIAGITIEIGGDTTNLQKSLKGVDKELKTTQSTLKDVDKLLKMNPGNLELLRQKAKGLSDAIDQTKTRLQQLKDAQEGVAKGTPEWDALQREIIETEGKLKSLEQQQRSFGSVSAQVLKEAGRKVSEFGGKVENAGKKLSGISGAAGALGGALLKLGYDSIQSADEINTLAKQTGFSTEEIQKLQYAADRMDVSFESVSGAMKKFKSKIDPSNESLKALGVEVTNADGSLRNANDVFFETVSALSQIENETERDQAAMDLFGKSADELAGIIDDGGEAFREFGAEAESLGLILDQDTLDSLNATNDELDKVKANIAGTAAVIGANVGSVVAPLLEKISEAIGKVTEKLRQLTPEQTETIMKVVGIVAAVAPAVIIIGKLISGIGSIISVIGAVVGVLGGPLTLAIGAAVAIGVVLYKNWDKIKETAVKLWDGMKAGWEKVKTGVTGVVDNIKQAATERWEHIKTTFNEAGGGIQGAVAVYWDGIKTAWTEGFNALDSLTGGKLSELKEQFTAKVEEIKDKVKEIWDKIKSFFQEGITLPHIKLPHFVISPPGWTIGDLLKGIKPSLSIEWYKSAYDNPVMFTSPTVLPTANGYKGFGDGAGAEIVMGLDRLRELVGSNQNVNVTVVLEGDAKGIFRVVRAQNNTRTKATNYNALAVGG